MSLWIVRGSGSKRDDIDKPMGLENNFVYIGWGQIPDLSKLSNWKEFEAVIFGPMQ